jgi:DNA-binding SARP family transcriptional activator
MRLDFAVLGPLSVTAPDGVALPIGGTRRRAVLVRLLASPGQAVSCSRLCEDIWDGHPPPGAASTLQSHISALRKLLGAQRILHRPGGYILAAHSDEVDHLRFELLIRQGRHALDNGDARQAARVLGVALNCWRGTPLEDVTDSAWAQGQIRHLQELRATSLETWLQARLALGEPTGVATDAEKAIAENPYRERLWAQLMIALYRAGRQTDALAAYQRLRRLLADELGLHPCGELAALEHAILRQDMSLDLNRSCSPSRHAAKNPCPHTSGLQAPRVAVRFLPQTRHVTTLLPWLARNERKTPC